MEMTRNEFYKWAEQRVQWTENDLEFTTVEKSTKEMFKDE